MKSSKINRKRKIRTSEPQATIVSYLPDDIIAIILSGFPVKSLLKFKSVSKSWCSLISSKHFIKTHLEISRKNTNFTNHTIVIAGSFGSKDPNSLPSALVPILRRSSPYKSCTYAFDSLPTIHSSGSKFMFLLGCCNGLSCALMLGKEGRREFLLWNPSTRKSRNFRNIENSDIVCSYFEFFGFGFDEPEDEYKVFLGGITYGGERYVRLYSLMSKFRKRIDYPKGGNGGVMDGFSFMHRSGTFVDGKLYWLTYHDDDVNNRSLSIVSFDMRTKMYGAVEKPTHFDWRFTKTMGVLGGCLSVVSGDPGIKKDVWVLKKYGVEQSWEKIMTIPRCMIWTNRSTTWGGPKPLCIKPDGEIVFAYGQSFFIYDPKKGTTPPRRIKRSKFCQFNVCIQSLVSPIL